MTADSDNLIDGCIAEALHIVADLDELDRLREINAELVRACKRAESDLIELHATVAHAEEVAIIGMRQLASELHAAITKANDADCDMAKLIRHQRQSATRAMAKALWREENAKDVTA